MIQPSASDVQVLAIPGLRYNAMSRAVASSSSQWRYRTALLVAANHRRLGRHPIRGSARQRIAWGKPYEILYLHRELVRLGRQLGVLTSDNAHLVALV